MIPYAVSDSYETAKRVSKGKSVMGSDCSVSEGLAVKVKNTWLIPGRIEPESSVDKAIRERREAKRAALDKAKSLGLSDDELAALTT